MIPRSFPFSRSVWAVRLFRTTAPPFQNCSPMRMRRSIIPNHKAVAALPTTLTWSTSLSASLHHYDNVADGSCEVRSRSEEEAMSGHQRRRATPKIIHNPHQPEGWWRDGADFFVAPPPRCTGTSRRRFANSTPSRSPQTSWYSWDKTLEFKSSAPSPRSR